MPKLTRQIYSFDEFTLDVTRGSLVRGGLEIKLRPKSFEVLKFLVENGGRLIMKDELIQVVWQGMAVTDDSLVKCVKDVRYALGDEAQQIIKTVQGRGYILEKEVTENGAAAQIYTEETTGIHLVIEERAEMNGHSDAATQRRGDVIVTPHRKSKVANLIGAVKRSRQMMVLTLASLVLLGGGLAYGLFVFFRQPLVSPFKSVSIKRLTTDGKAVTVAVSPDGKYFAYAISDSGRQSLWVRQVTAVNPTQIIAPADVQYNGLTFSPDGNFLYYVQSSMLYQTGTLGGSTRKLWSNVTSKVTFSPDGTRLAFVRRGTGDGRGTRLVLANSDGAGEEQILAYRKPPEAFSVNGCA